MLIKRYLPGIAIALAVTAATGIQAQADQTPSAPDAEVYFVNLKDKARVKSPFKVVFGLSGMSVAPAGVEYPNSGHHHLLIDRPPLGKGEDGDDEYIYSLPADENHIHFGKGHTETMLSLPRGTHTLQLVLADKNHIPHNPPVVSKVITVRVR